MSISIEFRKIHPQGGDRRGAFEELSFQLFARHFSGRTSIRRHGAGGDAGLEGVTLDLENRVTAGVQAKFFDDKLGSTQWKDLDESIRAALADNAEDAVLNEVIVTIPRSLTQSQFGKWTALQKEWSAEAGRLKFREPITFTLWDESALRGLLLTLENRGLLLHYFAFPDFDEAHCRRRTAATIRDLGDRYRPELHTPTAAEDKLHTFLRSERCRRRFIEHARENLSSRFWLPKSEDEIPEALRSDAANAESAWQLALQKFGDGVSLPPSFKAVAEALDSAAEALAPMMKGLSALIPPRKPRTDEYYYSPVSRSPLEEKLERLETWRSDIRSLAWHLRENAMADDSCLLLTGDPGTGKTHVLAEVCNRYVQQGGIVLFVEGAKFSTEEPPWSQFLRWAGFPTQSARDFVDTLSAMAADTPLPALICIDALNETPHRSVWRNGLFDFATELRANDRVKLLVSCRSDYVEQTLPVSLREQRAPGWAFAEHEGLGVDVFDAFPKYVAAYQVTWQGLPPLVQDFRNPLFLRIFCEAYSNRTPDAGSLSLAAILGHYARRKAELIADRIDCDPSQVLDTLRDLAKSMQLAHALQIPEREARAICDRHHVPRDASRYLYRALLSEAILADFTGPSDSLGSTQVVRFTYERVWDYFISLGVLPMDAAIPADLLIKLRDENWRWDNAGLISLLHVRFPEEGRGELCDFIAAGSTPDTEELGKFLESLPWRTRASVSARTEELFRIATGDGSLAHQLDHLVPLAPNPLHPWNAEWLHDRLAALPLAERDRTWTFWVNQHLVRSHENSPLRELLAWAERVRLDMLGDEHRLLLATVLAWCSSTTFVEGRKRLAACVTRLLAGRTGLATRLVTRFLQVDDPYVREWVLLAAAGAAQHASAGDINLMHLAQVVHDRVFAGQTVEPHLLIRHYAAEICDQAHSKGVLPNGIAPASFRPPFRSRWPTIWSEETYRAKEKATDGANRLFRSVAPDLGGPGYGDWGRYVMQSHVTDFLRQSRSEAPPKKGEEHRDRFDARICSRYVVQRVFEIGWDPDQPDAQPGLGDDHRGRKVERLSKKYQWIALYEFLGFLSDHHRFREFDNPAATFRSARQLIGSGLLDPFIVNPPPQRSKTTWDFVRPSEPWWRGHLDPLPRPLSDVGQREFASGVDTFHPEKLLALNDGTHEWLTFSAFHEWDEPRPVWEERTFGSHTDIETAIQSYLVDPKRASRLLNELTVRSFALNSSSWIDEPKNDSPLAALRMFPLHQEELSSRCELDEHYATRPWRTGACSTTCRCAPDEELRRTPEGAMPSPQLALIGNLRWLGSSFDFAPPGATEPFVRHVGEGFRGACIGRRDAVLEWLQRSGKWIVWRCYIQKYLHRGSVGENHMRVYWSTFFLKPDGRIRLFGGATCTFHHGPGPDEELPWKDRIPS